MPAPPAAPSSMARTAGACGGTCSNIIAIAASRRCSSATRSASTAKQASASGQRFDYRFGDHELSWPRDAPAWRGPVQQRRHRRHAVPALAATRAAAQAPDRIEAAVRSGLRDTQWPGRLEVIAQDPLTVIDVGHTPDGIRQSLASLKAIHGADNWILVTGASGDKKADEIVGALAPAFDTIICDGGVSQGRERAEHRRRRAARQSGRGYSCRRYDRGRGASGPGAGGVAQAKTICSGRTVPGDRIRHGRARRPRAGFEVFLSKSHPSSLRGAKRRSNPFFLFAERWIASLRSQ